MKNLALTIKYYFEKQGIKIDLTHDVVVMWNGGEEDPYIASWNIPYPQPSMEELEALEPEAMLYYARQNKLAELDTKFNDAIENGHMTCSFGVEIDANNDALRNVGNLLLVMGADDKELFCDYNNQFHELTRIQVEMIQKEIIGHIKGLYSKKWMYREQINTLTTAEEIDSIVIEF
jgi:hypothetical protein